MSTPSAPPPKPRERGAQLIALRETKTSASAYAFVRASIELFYDAIAAGGRAFPRDAPSIWIDGDCHYGNIGAVADGRGGATLELNDLDETVIGNPAFDVVRLALSLAIAARSAGVPGSDVVEIGGAVAHGYERALERSAVDRARSTVDDAESDEYAPPLRELVREAARQTRTELLNERAPRSGQKNGRVFKLGGRYWPLTKTERAQLIELMDTEPLRGLISKLSEGDEPEVEVVDVAFRVAGTGSLGAWRSAVLLALDRERQSKKARARDEGWRMLDVKEAQAAHAPRDGTGVTPANDAERIVAGARVVAPQIGHRMVATTVCARRVVVRELLPQDHKVALDGLSRSDWPGVARTLAGVVGRAHGRQLAAAEARAWLDAFRAGKRDDHESPRWLWDVVVDLVGVHEGAYLRHCAQCAVQSSKPVDSGERETR